MPSIFYYIQAGKLSLMKSLSARKIPVLCVESGLTAIDSKVNHAFICSQSTAISSFLAITSSQSDGMLCQP